METSAARSSYRGRRVELASGLLVVAYALLLESKRAVSRQFVEEPAGWREAFPALELIFVCLFVGEQLLKLLFFGRAYFHEPLNALDCAVVLGTTTATVLWPLVLPLVAPGALILCVRLLRCCRLFSLVRPLSETLPPDGLHFELGVLFMITLYALLVFVDLAILRPPAAWRAFYNALDVCFNVAFLVELLAKLHVWGAAYLVRRPRQSASCSSCASCARLRLVNAFDSVVVLGSFGFMLASELDLPIASRRSGAAHALRLLRLVRLLRLLTAGGDGRATAERHSAERRSAALGSAALGSAAAGSAARLAVQDAALQLCLLSLLLCAAAIALVSANDALAKVLGASVSLLSLLAVLFAYKVCQQLWTPHPKGQPLLSQKCWAPASLCCRCSLSSLPTRCAKGSCQGILPRDPAKGSCQGILPRDPSKGSSQGILPRDPAKGSCPGILSSGSFKRLLQGVSLRGSAQGPARSQMLLLLWRSE